MINANSKPLLELSLRSEDPRVRAAGCIVARRHGLEYIEDLIDSVGHDHELVRQAGRESLFIISSSIVKSRPVDFGPVIGETSNLATCASQNMWKAWFAENRAKQNDLAKKKESMK